MKEIHVNNFRTYFATKLRLMVDYHTPKGPVEIVYCCVKGQGHSKGSKFQLFVQMISFEQLNLL